MVDLAAAAAALPGVTGTAMELDELVVHAGREALPDLLVRLRDDPAFACEQLMDLCGVDWPERPERFEVVYNLLSVSLNHRVPRDRPGFSAATPVPSCWQIWPVATWFEREAWDLYRHRVQRTSRTCAAS